MSSERGCDGQRVGIDAVVHEAFRAELGEPVRSMSPVTGGDINDAYRVELPARSLFVKTRAGAPPRAFADEAAGLLWLAEPGGLPIPEVVLAHERFLALEWVDAGRLSAAGEEALGRGLAQTHLAGAPGFGATPVLADPSTRATGTEAAGPEAAGTQVADTEGPGTETTADAEAARGMSGAPATLSPAVGHAPMEMGAVSLPNDPAPTFAAFYAERRIVPLADHARAARRLSPEHHALMHRLAERLPQLVGPPEPPARIHGDLWAGNVLAGTDGQPWLIDPVAHGGHRELDLAALRVFGGPGQRCFDAYAEVAPLAEGHAERVPLMQLSVILLHVALFGGSYEARAVEIARRYL